MRIQDLTKQLEVEPEQASPNHVELRGMLRRWQMLRTKAAEALYMAVVYQLGLLM